MKNLISGPSLAHEFIENTLHGHTDQYHYRITVYADGVFRVQISPDNTFEENPYSLVSAADKALVPQEKRQPDQLTLQTKTGGLEVNFNPFRLRLITPEGHTLCEDDPGLGHGVLGMEVAAYKRQQPGERFVGLGEKTGSLDRRGSAFTHWNTDNFGYREDSDPLYMSTPFWMGIHHNLCYAIYLNNTYKSEVNLGASTHRFTSFKVDGGTLDYFMFCGDGPAQLLDAYTHLTGRPFLPPRWSLGLQQCRYSYYPANEVYTLAETFRKKQIPADVIYLDIHYMDAYKVFTWHPEHFADPKNLLEHLRGLGFKIVLIFDPGIKTEPGYAAYDNGLKGDHFVKYPDGERYQGQVWPGWCHFPDFTNPETRNWWGDEMQNVLVEGVAGFWTDMNEPATWGQRVPDLIEFNMEGRGASHKEVHNLYGFQMARATYEGALRYRPDARPFILTRAGFSGVQRFAATWTGDNRAEDVHMLAGVRLLNAMGLAGVPFCGMDIGGFVGDSDRVLYARWMTIGAFSPLCRLHTMVDSMDSEPWSYGEQNEAISRNYANLRYRLLPYTYSLFYQTSQTGLPVQRSLAITNPHHHQTYTYDLQFWLGDFILVAPCSAYQNYTQVFLPPVDGDQYYYLYEDDRFPAGEPVVGAPLPLLPAFVKPGAIIPMQNVIQHTGQETDGVLQLHLYNGNTPTEFNFYWDAGDGHQHHKGQYLLRKFRWEPANQTLYLDRQEGQYQTPWPQIRLFVHGFPEPAQARTDNGDAVTMLPSEYRFVDPLPAFDPFGNDQTVHDARTQFADLPWEASQVEIISPQLGME